MTTQIAVRLPDETVAFLDEQVASGAAKSRAELVARALKREQRRIRAARDVEILRAAAAAGEPDELDGLAEYSARLPRPELD